MGSSCTVNVIEQCQISPPSASVPPSSLPLTIFDVLWLPLPHMERLFIYELPCSSKDHFTNTILPNIKHSLSLSLQHFFPLVGNLIWPQDSSKPEIRYVDGDSVLLTVAESDYSEFRNLVEWVDVGVFYPLVPRLLNSSTNKLYPLMAFQVTLFPDKGMSLGITFSHVVADGRTLHHFIKIWASICRNIQNVTGSGSLQLPCYDRHLLEEPNWIHTACSNYIKKANITRHTFYTSKHQVVVTDKVYATFLMGNADLMRLRNWVSTCIRKNKEENATPLHLSTFVLICAYVWVCSIKARRSESFVVASDDEEEDQFEYFIFPVDCRARLDPPLPITYFGNCISLVVVRAKTSDLISQQGVLIASEFIGNMIRDIENGNAILKRMEVILSESDFSSSPRVLTVAGSTKFDIYDTDFGWGKPKKTQFISIARSGAISLSESPNEIGAVEVGLVREKVELDAFASLFANTIADSSTLHVDT